MNDPPDDDCTVIRPAAALHPSAAASGKALPPRTRVGRFELTGVIGEGGFSIVYSAWDDSLQRHVAVKEYIPSTLAARAEGMHVTVRSERHREAFEAGLRSFVNEARLLASLDHHSLVEVYDFWEDRGTAFMVMPWYQGSTLKETLRARKTPPDEAWLLKLLGPLTEALSALHAQHCYHRDIAPDNVMLLGEAETPLLLDFGAARRVIGDMTQALTVILKPGYAPLEQYAEVPGLRQGPWTDVYALAALVHFAIHGSTPPAAVGRLVNDTFVPLERSAVGRYSPGFLAALDKALAVRPEDRTQTIEALRSELGLSPGADPGGPPGPVGSAHAVATAPRARRRLGAWAGTGAASVAAIIAALVWWRVPSVGGVPPPLPASLPAPAPQAEAPVKAAVPAPPSAAPAPMPAEVAFSPSSEFDKVVAAATPGFVVQASAREATLKIGRDELLFTVTSSRDGYVHVLVLEPDGSVTRLFPNGQSASNRIRAGNHLSLPQPSWPLKTTLPAGPERFLVLVSDQPREHDPLLEKPSGTFGKLMTGPEAAALAASAPQGSSVYAGRPACKAAARCSADYGAATFEVMVVP